MRSRSFVPTVAVLLLAGCDQRLRAPPPETREDSIPFPELPVSVLDVPVRVDLGPLVAEVEEVVPRRWGDLERRLPVPGNDRVHVAVELRRGDLDATLVGSTATLSSTIWYRVQAWYDPPVLPEVSASCAPERMDERPRMRVTIEAPIAVDRDWRLSTRSRRARVRPLTDSDRDRCQISFLSIDITERVADAAGSFFQRHRATLDSLVASADVRSSFESWWSLLTEPIRLAEGVWLVLDPQGVARGPIEGEGDVVQIPLRLRASPRVVVGSRPASEPVELPPLDTLDRADAGFQVLVEGEARYDSIAARLRRELGPVAFERSGRRVEVTVAGLTGIGGGRVALETRVEGDVRARLYFVGTPVYDPGTGMVSVPDLELDIATRNLLLSGPAWLADANIERWLRERATWPAAPAVEWIAARLREGLNARLSDEVSLVGEVDDVSIVGVAAGTRALFVRASVRADARLDVGEVAAGRAEPAG